MLVIVELRRLCTDGTYGEVTYENCRALKPTGLAYSVSSYVLDQNETMSTGRPLYGNIITAFSVEPLLPEGLSLDTTTGVISGTATELKESTSYTVTGANNDDSTTTVITIAVVLPSCQATESLLLFLLANLVHISVIAIVIRVR